MRTTVTSDRVSIRTENDVLFMHQVDIVKTLVDVFKLSTDEAERAILLAARVEEHSEVSLLEHWIATHDSVGEIAARVWYLWTWHREDLSATF